MEVFREPMGEIFRLNPLRIYWKKIKTEVNQIILFRYRLKFRSVEFLSAGAGSTL
jgi:hypothetical protein